MVQNITQLNQKKQITTVIELVILYSGDGIILPESIDKKILEIYSKWIFRLEFIFNKNKGNHIDYAIVYGESNIENKKYYFEEKFIPSDKIK